MAEENFNLGSPIEFTTDNEIQNEAVPEKLIVESKEEMEILKSVVEMLQTIGRKMDEKIKEESSSDEEYRGKTRVSELLKTRFGKDYLIVTTLLGMVLKNPKQANMLASILTNAEDFEKFIHSVDVVYDENKGAIDIVSIDDPQTGTTIITDLNP